MAIIVNIDVMLAKRKMRVTELAERVGITMANISVLKNGKAKAIRLSTLEAICQALECQPGDILQYKKNCIPPHRGNPMRVDLEPGEASSPG
jgi:putative transcriptional regulator